MSEHQCRRCGECVGCDHHWLDNIDFGAVATDADRPDATGNGFICKHCPAVGDECENCGGSGSDPAGADQCPACTGHGVRVAEPRTYEQWEASFNERALGNRMD